MMNLALSLPEKTDVDFKTEAPPPETQSGPVYKVVGSTFEKVVLDPTKDVLLEMYRPPPYLPSLGSDDDARCTPVNDPDIALGVCTDCPHEHSQKLHSCGKEPHINT